MRLAIGLALCVCAASLCAYADPSPNMVASFYDMSDSKFSLRAIAPRESIREYAVCKAVWFSEKKHVSQISLSNPVYGPPVDDGPVKLDFPQDWVSVTTTAYMNTPSPDGNPMVSVAEKAAMCRRVWDWY